MSLAGHGLLELLELLRSQMNGSRHRLRRSREVLNHPCPAGCFSHQARRRVKTPPLLSVTAMQDNLG